MKKGLVLKLLGIILIALMVISCTPKETATVTVNVNFRSGDTIIRVLQKGEIVTLTGEVTEGWTQVKHNGDIGWVSTQYLNKIAPETQSKPTVGQTAQEKPKADTTTTTTKTTTTTGTAAAQTSSAEFQMDGVMLVKYTGSSKNITIPNGVEWIAQMVFENKQLTSVTIPNSVTTILKGAFRNCQLTSVTIPNGVLVIDGFQENRLTSVTIPNSVTDLGGFQNNQLTSVTIPNSVKEIYESAFGYNKLTSIIIPNSVTKIGSYAFSNNQLTSVTIPASVRSIGLGVFMNNPLQSVTFERGNIESIIWGRAFPTEEVYTFSDSSTYELKREYEEGGAGTYTKSGNTWRKQ